MQKHRVSRATKCASAFLSASFVAATAAAVPSLAAAPHNVPGTNWMTYNGNFSGTRYSPLSQINASNAQNINAVCAYQLGSIGPFESSPVVVNGVMYVTTAHKTVAINASNCHPLWTNKYHPTGVQPFNPNRGVAYYHNNVYRGTPDGHLIDLNAKTGQLIWNKKVVDSAKGYFLSSAPIAWHDMVFIGTSGADWGTSAKMFAFDAKTGKELWSFNEIKPSTFGSAKAAGTGGGSNWTSYTLDPTKGLIYIPVGNPAPDFAASYRPGSNLYTDSVLVLNATTGKLVRDYQQISNDSHDWDTAAAPVLFSQNGIRYVAAANKGGYLYVYNNETHKLVYKVPDTTQVNWYKKPTKSGRYTCPGWLGGVEWNGPAYDPSQKSLLVNSVDWCGTYKLGEIRYIKDQLYLGGAITMAPVSKASGWVTAFDASSGKVLWKDKEATPMVAGVTPTAGGVIFTGALDGEFLALNAKTGQKLYGFDTGGGIAGGVSTYLVGGKQYVAVTSGNASRTNWKTTGAATVFIFALPQN